MKILEAFFAALFVVTVIGGLAAFFVCMSISYPIATLIGLGLVVFLMFFSAFLVG